ncbi:nuclear receptor subfamily 1 group I member 2 [Clupea harengus]|uniref:Nuclear receptor subfamily 1 group I member 2 n=1 Tax=Clupea harengus TaxID=7950 RepID=A0A6P3W227_CLUHA|nr:nuclear receptor subfamily 1 group I member 2 [Clupea harengus]
MSEEEEQQQTKSSEEEKEDEEEEEDEGPKICQVCGDQANGYHFNAMTCEGCKGFFRRAVKRLGTLRCPFQKNCVITKSNRRQCQACRMQKCLSIGMRRELIMTDEAVEERRWKIKRKRLMTEPVLLSPQQEALIQELLKAHGETFDRTCSNFNQFRPLDRCASSTSVNSEGLQSTKPDAVQSGEKEWIQSSDGSGSSSSFLSQSSVESNAEQELGERSKGVVFTSLSHINDLSTYMIQNVINYAKIITDFRALAMEDQISLLKGATFEMMQIRFNMLFNDKTGIWECGPLHYCMDDASRAGFQPHLLDPLMKFHYTLRGLQLHDVEYVLMQAISLFSPDRPGVTNHDVISHHQETLAIALLTYIESKREEGEKHLLFPKIIACLTEMRTMNEEYTKQVMQIQDIQPELSPLILEVVSQDS